ncbi:MAG: T9SS type A sorting domain-containing protein, partial [Bacteroidales bacterium]
VGSIKVNSEPYINFNSANKQLLIKNTELKENCLIEIYNTAGKLLMTQKISKAKNPTIISLNNLSKGLYIVSVKGTKHNLVSKIIIN